MKIEINAKERKSKGTGASRRLRHEGTTPGILYGGVKDAISLEIDSKELFMQFRHEAFHASILTLNLEGKKESVILRDFQMHPVCLLYTSPSPRDATLSRMPSSA